MSWLIGMLSLGCFLVDGILTALCIIDGQVRRSVLIRFTMYTVLSMVLAISCIFIPWGIAALLLIALAAATYFTTKLL